MDKGIGFNRNIYLPWLDAAAAFAAETDDPAEMRARLEPVVGQDVKGVEARRKTIDGLINTWLRSAEIAPDLQAEAVSWFQSSPVTADRLWLHYGLTLLYSSFFRECLEAIGQLGRYQETITTRVLRQRLAAARGDLGSVNRVVSYIVASLRNWGVMTDGSQRHTYVPQRQILSASSTDLEAWLLACALHAHPADELPFADLSRLPELFPFRFTLDVEDLRQSPRFTVQRQGTGWDMVRLVSNRSK